MLLVSVEHWNDTVILLLISVLESPVLIAFWTELDGGRSGKMKIALKWCQVEHVV